ncbi:FAD-binding oxidoreductase [Herminiimonas sp. CN]|uniref:FAD-binding oxidoreductase n=1 Tax=Herminiimonas sp. CN TaxID=1349818 RepID=UPI00047368C8|nr:FAD-binding oxidoreductase [Herminiimonas sp. CN]
MSAQLLTELRAALGSDAVLAGDEIDARYIKEYFSPQPAHCQPLAVVRPRDTGQVAAVLRLCNEHRQPVVPQGGMTGLAGAALPNSGELVLSLERLRGIEELDRQAATMTLLAGTPLQQAQEAAAAQGFLLAIDLGARGSCQVGGNVATNAGGNRVIRYGMTRQQVLGLEAVLVDGTVISSLNKMQKNNAGYDLKQLFIGTEGTLGVITRVVFRLEPLPSCVQTALCAVNSYQNVVALLRHAQRRLSGRLSAFEVMWSDFYAMVTMRIPGQRAPLPAGSPFYVLLDLQGADPVADAALFESMLEQAFAAGLITDAAVSASEKETQSFWHLRDAPGEFPLVWPTIASFDISLPIGCIGNFVDTLKTRLQQRFPGCEYVHFGHIGDSNLHVCVHVPNTTPETFPEHGIKDCLYGLLCDYQGSISAEHGVGMHKKDYLSYSRTPEEISLMQTLKSALDPHRILSPGRVL